MFVTEQLPLSPRRLPLDTRIENRRGLYPETLGITTLSKALEYVSTSPLSVAHWMIIGTLALAVDLLPKMMELPPAVAIIPIAIAGGVVFKAYQSANTRRIQINSLIEPVDDQTLQEKIKIFKREKLQQSLGAYNGFLNQFENLAADSPEWVKGRKEHDRLVAVIDGLMKTFPTSLRGAVEELAKPAISLRDWALIATNVLVLHSFKIPLTMLTLGIGAFCLYYQRNCAKEKTRIIDWLTEANVEKPDNFRDEHDQIIQSTEDTFQTFRMMQLANTTTLISQKNLEREKLKAQKAKQPEKQSGPQEKSEVPVRSGRKTPPSSPRSKRAKEFNRRPTEVASKAKLTPASLLSPLNLKENTGQQGSSSSVTSPTKERKKAKKN